jgi:Mg2+-importing ATPase
MLSMAVASGFLPFLPLTAGQVLLNNFLSDIPAIGLAGDAVDRELIERPRRWDMRFIGRFMVEFGLLSSVFDFLMFATLVAYFAAPAAVFRTAWFVGVAADGAPGRSGRPHSAPVLSQSSWQVLADQYTVAGS